MNILIVEDHAELAAEVSDYLSRHGFVCRHCTNVSEALDELGVNVYDAMLLDLNLPDGSGFDILKAIRAKQSQMAIIVITARGELDDRISGLQLGADDYLTKPFALPELSARLGAVIRRMHGFVQSDIDVHGFTLKMHDYKVLFNGQPVNLTKKEFDIFRHLVLNKNRVLTRLQLTEHLWGDILEVNADSNFIDVHVRNLRKKLSAFEPVPWLETVRNVGYRIDL